MTYHRAELAHSLPVRQTGLQLVGQRKCACGQHTTSGEDCDSCRQKRVNLKHEVQHPTEAMSVPPIVNEVLRSPGRSLDAQTRARMEPRFGHEFSQVRVHTDERAASSAKAINAKAYAVQNNIIFGSGFYQPQATSGQRLLAHELTHVVQQQQSGTHADAEARADSVAERVTGGQTVTQAMIGQTAAGLYTQENEEEVSEPAAKTPTETTPAFSLRWLDLARIGSFQLTPPLLQPGFSPGFVSLSPMLQAPLLSSPTSPSGVPRLPTPALLPVTAEESPPMPDLTTPTPTSETEESSAAQLPSRLSVANVGRFSLGLRLGLPELNISSPTGMPPSALQESLRRSTIINQTLTGNVPSGWEAVDKGLLARAIWGIVSTNIAPDLARSLTSRLSTSAGPAGTSFELDLALITDFSSEVGGGLSFTIRH
jgi:hypothetical protein